MEPAEWPQPDNLRFGIAITTFNRRDILLRQIENIRNVTRRAFKLVICDDGSADGTVEALETLGEIVIGGTNRGIAWNKNRGLFYLCEIARCDVILLLDDDVAPVPAGWEEEWIAAAWRYGHVNHSLYRETRVAGSFTAEDPGLVEMIPGWALAFSRFALAEIGYFDLRFGRYGHEHSDMSFRAVRCGHGGIVLGQGEKTRIFFYAIDGGLKAIASATYGTEAEIAANGKLLGELKHDPVCRPAWRNDAEMRLFLGEIAEAAPTTLKNAIVRENRFASLGEYKASLGLQQTDLGECVTIHEIRIHMLPETPAQARIGVSVAIDGHAWVELGNFEATHTPLVWAGPGAAWARYVRVVPLENCGPMHIGQMEVLRQAAR